MGLQTLSDDFQIQNSRLQVRVRKQGAELSSLYDRECRRELLWQGDPAIWAGTAPILFPVVGRMRDGGFRFGERFYEMPVHGFAADTKFSIESHSSTAITLCLSDDEYSRKLYPFAFNLRVHLQLESHALRVAYEVQNPAHTPLIFSLGSHPAFALPARTMEEAGAQVRFDAPESHSCHRIRRGLLGGEESWPLRGNTLDLNADTFAEDAIILRYLRSRTIALYARDEHLITLDTGGAPHLGLWAKPNAPYLCIEPWLSTDDGVDAPREITLKPDFVTLPGGHRSHMFYRIIV